MTDASNVHHLTLAETQDADDQLDAVLARLMRANRGLEATLATARALGGETHLDRLLDLTVHHACALADARSAALLMAEEGVLRITAVGGDAPDDLIGRELPVTGTIAGRVLRSRRSEALLADPRLAAELLLDADTALLIPLVHRGRASGVLACVGRLTAPDVPFAADDVRVMLSFATSAATAIATARQIAEQRERDAEELAVGVREQAASMLAATLPGLVRARAQLVAAVRGDGLSSEEAIAMAVQLDAELHRLREAVATLEPAARDGSGDLQAAG